MLKEKQKKRDVICTVSHFPLNNSIGEELQNEDFSLESSPHPYKIPWICHLREYTAEIHRIHNEIHDDFKYKD